MLALGLAACGDPVDPPLHHIEPEVDVMQALASAYRSQNFTKLEALLAPDFTFYRNAPDPDTGEASWDRATEMRIHHRMFDPESIAPSEPQLAIEYWLQQVSVTLTAQSSYNERLDLYTTADPPGPLDPSRWIAEEATYSTDLFLQLQGENDFMIRGRVYVVVIVDRTLAIGEPGKFLIYRLEDLGRDSRAQHGAQEVIEVTWTSMKEIYR